VAGRAVTRYVQKTFKDTNYRFTVNSGIQLSQSIKETHGFIALDFQEALISQADVRVECELVPDVKIPIGTHRFRCPELLFQPKLDGFGDFNVAELIFESIMRCDAGLRPLLWSNIVLAGGTTLATGFEERLKKELTALAPEAEINFVSAAQRQNAAWVGGSIIGGLELFPQMVVTRDEFRESAANALRRRFY
jgi:actin-related protein